MQGYWNCPELVEESHVPGSRSERPELPVVPQPGETFVRAVILRVPRIGVERGGKLLDRAASGGVQSAGVLGDEQAGQLFVR